MVEGTYRLMGFILEELPEAYPYHGEVRTESFYLSGAQNFTWSRIDPETNERVFWDADERPEGEGWETGYYVRRHGIYVYENPYTRQGTVEILIEDIPKIRAVLDQIEAHVKQRKS